MHLADEITARQDPRRPTFCVLEGTVLRLMAYASLTGPEISLELAQEALRHISTPVSGGD